MNGRVYDYNLARFMSVDPFVHQGSQGLNPYSYILNNPLSGTDPSGYSPEPDVETKTMMVSTTGSKIKHKVTVSATQNSDGTVTVTFSGNNGAAVSAAKDVATSALSGSDFEVSDIGGASQIANQDRSGSGGGDTICVTASGADSCGSKSSNDERKEAVDKHVFTGEVRSSEEMDAAVIAHSQNLEKSDKEQAFLVGELGEIVTAIVEESSNSCATIRLSGDAVVAGLAHTHPEGDTLAESQARELPGPLDVEALTKGLVQYFITPTNAIRKIEVIKTEDGYEPRLTTIQKGNTYKRRGQIRKIERWRRTWDDRKNYEAMSDL